MESGFDPEALLRALPARAVEQMPAETRASRRRSVGDCPSYNGFTGKERLRTALVAKWLVEQGAMTAPAACDICGGEAHHFHAENYYDLATWIDLCRGCHSRLHNRFRYSSRWSGWLDEKGLPAYHWARLTPDQEFDFAEWLRGRDQSEPTYEDFILKSDAGSQLGG